MHRKILYLSVLIVLILSSCTEKINVDTILLSSKIYAVDSSFNRYEAIAINADTIVAIGSKKEITGRYTSENTVDLGEKVISPGLIDAHCHFLAYGIDQNELDLKNVISFDDMIDKVTQFASNQNYPVIVGRGWNEEDWAAKTRPSNYKLNFLFPETPVILQRIDGHAVLANQAALDLAGIDADTKIDGGHVELINGFPTGLLVDAAASKLLNMLPPPSDEDMAEALLKAQAKCISLGLTGVADAGLTGREVACIDSMQKAGSLHMRVYAMAAPDKDDIEKYYPDGPIYRDKLVVSSVKIYCDGALGSRGAWLKTTYCDDTTKLGLPQREMSFYRNWANWCFENGFQMNTHCIGNKANQEILKIYSEVLPVNNDLRWRIEHAQIVDHEDMHYFREYNILPSVQPTHAVSDMYMAKKRLCSEERLKGAYAYRDLLDTTGILPLGTDFPVEEIDPLGTYYAAINRRSTKRDVFRPEQKLDAISTLKGMTIWAAKANRMDHWVGSLEVGKKADLTIYSEDILQSREKGNLRVDATMIGGKWVYGPNN